MREPVVSRNPVYYPGVCVGCGVQSNRRWYVELGINLDYYFNPMNDGNITLCNECWNALVKRVNSYVKTFVESNKGKLDNPKINGLEGIVDGPGRIDSDPIGDDQATECNDQSTEPVTDESEQDDASQFRSFFANTG